MKYLVCPAQILFTFYEIDLLLRFQLLQTPRTTAASATGRHPLLNEASRSREGGGLGFFRNSECFFPHDVSLPHEHCPTGKPRSSHRSRLVAPVPRAESIPDSGSNSSESPSAARGAGCSCSLLQLTWILEREGKRAEGLQVVDTDEPTGCCL